MSEYTPPDESAIKERIGNLINLFSEFTEDEYAGESVPAPAIEFAALGDCVRRVHQREHYFKIFHDMPEGMSEVKAISLYCFWLLKYRPFFLPFSTPIPVGKKGAAKKSEGKDFLERFCIYLLARVVRRIYKAELPISEEGVENLVYSLRHHDITKEALTELFEILEDVVKAKL